MNRKGQTVVELMLLLAISVLALSIIYSLYSSQMELSSISKETSIAKSTINKIINSANSLALSGAGSTEKILIEVPEDANVLDSNITGKLIYFKLSNGSNVFGFSDVNIVGEFKKNNGQFVFGGYYVYLTFDGDKVILSYDDFELNTTGIFVSAKQGTITEKVFTIRNSSSQDATFWLVNNFSFSSFAELNIDPSDVSFTLAPNETRVIDLNIVLSKFSSGNYAGSINVIGEINDGVSDTNISKTVFVSVESFLEFEPVMFLPKSSSFSLISGTSTVKSFSLCNSSESNASITWQRDSNPDANMLDWFTWPIVDSEGALITSVESGECAYFDLNFMVPFFTVANTYDANITVTYGDGNTSSAYFFIDVSHTIQPYSLFFSTSSNSLSANYFLSNYVSQRTDANYFTVNGELDWNGLSRGSELVSSNPLFDSSLVGLWHLNDKNSSGWILNSANNVRDGLLSGGADNTAYGLWDSNSVYFDGAGTKYIDLGTSVTNPSLDLNQEFTVSAWVNYKGGHSVNAMSAIYSSEYYWSYNHGWSFHINDQIGTGVLEFAAGQNVIMGQGVSNVPQNEWTHVLMTRTINNQIKLYINGVLDVVRDLNPAYVITSTPDSPIRIGMRASQQDNDDFNGSIEEVAVWNRVLSPTEVSQLYTLQKVTWIDNNLVAYYKFNSKSGNTIFDSARKNNGVLSGGADNNGIGLWDSNALWLNGTTDYVNLLDFFNLTGSSFTTSAWFNPTSLNGVVLGMWGGGWSKFEINLGGGNIVVYNSNNDGPDYVTSCGTAVLHKWQHIAVVGNYATGKIDCYLNGVNQGNGTLVGGTFVNGQWNVGGRVVGGAIQQLFSGRIDEVKIYDRALSASEVLSDYNSFLNAKFVEGSIIDATVSSDWNSIKVNKDINYSFGKEICGVSDSLSCNPDKFNNGLVGLWHFNDKNSSGWILNSVSGVRDGELKNSANINTNGLWGTSTLDLSGSTQYVSIESSNSPSSITISAWIKMVGWSNYPAIVAKGYWDGGGESYGLHIRNNYSLWLDLNNSGSRVTFNPTDKVLSLNTWQHIVATISSDNLIIYIDGVPVNAGKGGAYNISSTAIPISVGRLPGFGYFNGEIEDVGIWDRALSASEVMDLYRKGVSQLDLDIYSCSDSSCAAKTGSQYISNVSNNSWTNLNSSVLNSRYLGFDAYFKKASGFGDYNASSFYVGSFVNDFNVIFSK